MIFIDVYYGKKMTLRFNSLPDETKVDSESRDERGKYWLLHKAWSFSPILYTQY